MTQLNRTSRHLLLTLIILLGGCLRFYALGAKTIWLDEAFSIWIAGHSLPELWSWLIRIDHHPPLYYSLLHLWQAIFGDLQGPVRAFSALCSTLTIPVLYAAAQRLFDRPTALIAALILAVSPFHVRFAQEARMYALLTLAAAAALYFLVHILLNVAPWTRFNLRLCWIGLAVAQAAVLLSHNTATLFFPLALNLAIGGALLWKYGQGGVSSWPALNDVTFERQWLRGQALAVVFWLPWSIAFVIQATVVDGEFWLQPPTLATVWLALQDFNFAFLPGWVPLLPLWNGLYWVLAGLGVWTLRRTPARAWLLLALMVIPFLGELIVSLRRPIFYDRTLIWTTLPYFMLIALGIRHAVRKMSLTGGRVVQSLLLVIVLGLSSLSLTNYYAYFDKEEWDQAAGYVAEHVQPGDLILFNATWVQIPFEYYFRHYHTESELRGLPVDLFDRGVLEPKMTEADTPYLHDLLENQQRVWLVYSHDWYTDPDKIIPRELNELMQQTEQQEFVGLQVMRFEAR